MDANRTEFPMLVGNKEVAAAGGDWAPVLAPANGTELARVPVGGPEDVDLAVESARSAFRGGKWGRTGAARRGQILQRMVGLLSDHFDELCRLECRNTGKAINSVKGEVGQAIAELEFFAGAATKIQGSTNATPFGFLNYTLREPHGVCALIVPWNYPFLLAMRKVAPALAAGNSVVLKPATATPLSAIWLGLTGVEAGLPEGALNVITGPGGAVGQALVTHPGVDKVSFTGSTENGRAVLQAAGDDFRRVTLELGGKSPNLVFEDADLDACVPGSVWSVFYSAGQSCEARTRIFVQQPIYAEFVERFVATTQSLVVGDPEDPKTHVGSLISPGHRAGIEQAVEAALAAGAELLAGGARPTAPELEAGSYLLPTVLGVKSNSAAICQEEVFGPVVTVMPFDTESEAIGLANDTIYGLAASVWSRDSARALRVAGALRSGVVTVNQPFTVFPGTPFGGYKQSGWGREASIDALLDYTELKSVVTYTGTRPVDPFGLVR